MKAKSIARDIALMVILPVAGLLTFSENVRTVQVLGLLATGAAFGVFLARVLIARKYGNQGS